MRATIIRFEKRDIVKGHRWPDAMTVQDKSVLVSAYSETSPFRTGRGGWWGGGGVIVWSLMNKQIF